MRPEMKNKNCEEGGPDIATVSRVPADRPLPERLLHDRSPLDHATLRFPPTTFALLAFGRVSSNGSPFNSSPIF